MLLSHLFSHVRERCCPNGLTPHLVYDKFPLNCFFQLIIDNNDFSFMEENEVLKDDKSLRPFFVRLKNAFQVFKVLRSKIFSVSSSIWYFCVSRLVFGLKCARRFLNYRLSTVFLFKYILIKAAAAARASRRITWIVYYFYCRLLIRVESSLLNLIQDISQEPSKTITSWNVHSFA